MQIVQFKLTNILNADMATASFCDPCSDENKSVSATNYCSDCEERLCTDCAKSHVRFKAFKSHPVIDLSSVGSIVTLSAKKICNVHPEMILDYYCTDHDAVCCRACIPKDHRKCENVLPLEHASKDVKNSALFTDIMADIRHLIITLNDLHDDRESNLRSLLKNKPVIINRISKVKSQLLKQTDDIERDLQAELSSLQRKYENEINNQKEEISQVLDSLRTNENEIDFLKHHGLSNQLFIALYEQITKIQNIEAKVLQIVSNSLEIEITFDEKKVQMIDYFEPLSVKFNPCHVQYKSRKLKQAQIIADSTKNIVGFEKEMELKLKPRVNYCLRDAAITMDNNLLLPNYVSSDRKMYVYSECEGYKNAITFTCGPYGVTVIPDTDRAVVTLPFENSIQFINTTTMIKCGKVSVGFKCYCITAGRDRIYVGGEQATIKTLDTNGEILNSIKHAFASDDILFISYDEIREQFNVGCRSKHLFIKADGTLVHSKVVYGVAGVTLDRRGNVYVCGNFDNTIQRMSHDGENCEEMMNKYNGIDRPYGMCFNNDFTKFFVINNDNHGDRSVFVYNCRY
ncbi:unnamed protein product [Mytilus edulis]|uniref:B box-type domain-containing protein n=1 Tax=Mytilus edulis TaxID=6550 RepID=A0A8S3SMC8_MYTED|nr:unnamed protein product [Mytilus edulis]